MGSDNNERTPLLKGGCCGGNKTGGCCGGASGSRATDSLAPVPLKRGDKKNTNSETVWAIERRQSSSSLRSDRSDRRLRLEHLLQNDEPLVSKCGADGGQCCEYAY
jgi:hypothetical protein